MNIFLQAKIVLFINRDNNSDLKVGAPAFFLDSKDKLELFEEPTRFLDKRYVRNGSTPSPHTWTSAAYGLKCWFQFLQAIECDWHNASEQERMDFRDAYLGSISQKTGRSFSSAGVRHSMVVVRSFYQHCEESGQYHGDIVGSGSIALDPQIAVDSGNFAQVRSGKVNRTIDRALPKVRPGVKIHPLMARDLKKVLIHIGPQASNRNGDLRLVRDRLICDLGWAVGLRLNEINSLTTLQFMTLFPESDAPFVGMALTVLGKGSKTRQVIIPAWLVMDVHAYMAEERDTSIKACKSKSKHSSNQLFLGHAHSTRAGRPISNAAIQKMFREACLTLGLATIVEKTDVETGAKFPYRTPRHSIHDLRHTYSVLTYHAERANGNSEPWKKIQAQLGHTHLQTTIDTYLAHVEIFTDQSGLLDVRRLLGI